MSAKLLGMVLDANLPRPEKFVLAILADHGKEDGTDVYPSVAKIEFKTGYSERQVRDIMTSLQRLGLLVLVEEGGRGAGDTNEYRIAVEKIPVMDFKEWLKIHKGAVLSNARVRFSQNKGAVLSEQGGEKPQNKGAKTAPELKTNNQEQELKAELHPKNPTPQNPVLPINGNSKKPLSQSERESWDLRRWREAMKENAPQSGAQACWLTEEQKTEYFLTRMRDAAYAAGVTLSRLREILQPFYTLPEDKELLERLDPNLEIPLMASSP